MHDHRSNARSILTLAFSILFLVCYGFAVSKVHADVKLLATEAVGDAHSLNDSARPAATSSLPLTFAIHSSSKQQISDYVASLTDPKSPNYHKWLTAQQFGEKFGASTQDISSVVTYLSKSGFSNITVWPDRLFISADTTRAQAESTFSVEIHGYNRSFADVVQGLSPTYFAPDRSPVLDAKVGALIDGVFGLSSEVESRPSVETAQDYTSGPLQPADLANAYDINPLHNLNLEGQGETIAIYSPTAYEQSDITNFAHYYNLGTPKVNNISVSSGSTSGNTSLTNQLEACVDIETVLGQAPDATVNVYEAPNDGGFEIFEQVEKDDPNILSVSWGVDENLVSPAYASAYETIRQALAAEGISVFVASDDSGAYDTATGTVLTTTVDSSSAYVTAVGGTQLNTLLNNTWDGETAWSDSGGGLSRFFSEPSWQTGPGVSNSYSNGMRQVPDVSALAGSPGYGIFVYGLYYTVYGTSCSTPLWASTMSLIEESLGTRLGNINPALYSIASSSSSPFHDITSGSDGYYNCTAGWDFVTGWGSVDFGQLLTAFEGGSPSITSFTPTSGVAGTSVTITGTNLANTTSVTFGGVAATSITSKSSTQIVVQVPAGAQTGPIVLGYSSGSVSSSAAFTVLPPFTLSSSTSVSINQGSTGTTSIGLVNNGGFTGTVALTYSGLPSGVTAVLAPASIAGSTTSTLAFAVAPTTAAGTYTVTVSGVSGSTTEETTISLIVVAHSIISSIVVTPSTVNVVSGNTQQFTAVADDQFNNALTSQPSFTWSTSGGGTISSTSGIYTATTVGGPFTVSASTGEISGSANVNVNAAPNFAIAATQSTVSISEGASSSTTVSLTSENGFSGSVSLTTSTLPTGVSVVFSPTTISGASTSTLTFNVAPTTTVGTYTVTVTGTSGSTVNTTSVTLNVVSQSIFSSISITPASVTLVSGYTQQFTAIAEDQFGNKLTTQPSISWSATGGTISQAGIYLAGSTTGAFAVTATSGSVSETAAVQISASEASVPIYQINTGGGAEAPFVADEYFSGGSTYSNSASVNITTAVYPAPQGVYQSERFGNLTYTLPNLTPGATYTLRLHFAEIYWGASNDRLFNVIVNGSTVLRNFDIFATAGGKNKAIVESFGVTANSSGQVVIQFVTVKDNAKVSGIELAQVSSSTTTFSASPSTSVVTVSEGSAASTTISLNGQNGFSGTIALTTSPLPTGITASFSPSSVSGSSSSTLTFTAATTAPAGTYLVTVIGTSGSLVNTTTVFLTVQSNLVLSSIALSPSSTTISTGGTQQFTPTADDQFGNPLATQPSFTWTATGGSISQGGLYQAGQTTGSFLVTAAAAGVTGSSAVTVASQVTGTPIYQINAGGAAASPFVADEFYSSGGVTYSVSNAINTSAVLGPAPQLVYQTERYGNFTYTLPSLTPGSNYTLRLHFSENFWTAANDRLFDVIVNGVQVLTNFDIFATAGGEYTAVVESFPVTANSSGQVVIQFKAVKNNAKIDGIELLQP